MLCVWAAKLPLSCILSSRRKKRSSHRKPTRVSLLHNLRILPLEKETFWRASLIIFLTSKKTQRRISASNLSIFRWAALRTHAEPLSLLTYCVQISRQLSARTKKKKNLMKSLPLLFRHDPHLICGMSLRDVEHPELISWAKLTGFLTCRLSEKGKPNPASSHGSLYTQFHSWAAFEAPTPCNRSFLPKLKKKSKFSFITERHCERKSLPHVL